jgi:hypothetical protein
MKECLLMTECTGLSDADHVIAHLKKGQMLNSTLFRRRKNRTCACVVCNTNYVKRWYVIARHAVKSHFYIQISALNCTTQSEASEEFINKHFCNVRVSSVNGV